MDAMDYHGYFLEHRPSPPQPALPVAPPPRDLFTLEQRDDVLHNLAAVKQSVEELATQVSIAFHTLHQKRADPTTIEKTHEAVASSLDAACKKASDAWNLPKITPANDQEFAVALVDTLYFRTLYDNLVVDAKKLAFELRDESKQNELKRLKELVTACDAMTEDKTVILSTVTDEEREFVDITSCNFKKQDPLKEPQPLQLLDSVELPKEYKFRTGDAWLQTWSVIGYAQIADTIAYLTSISHRLHKLTRDLREDMKQAAAGSLRANTLLLITCDELEGMLTSYVTILKSKPRSKQIHAGWYYLRGLLSQLKTTKAAIASFDHMKSEAFGTKAKITEKLVLCLTAQEEGLTHLYEASELAAPFIKELPDQKEFIEVIGHKRLLLTNEEKKLAYLAFSSIPISQDELSSYLMKGFIKALYFSRDCEPAFKLVVAKCRGTPQFTTCLARSDVLTRLYEAFKQQYGESEHKELVHILELLHTTRPLTTSQDVLALDRYMRFHQAKKQLTECRALQKNRKNPRIEYVQEVLNQREIDWKDALECKKTPEDLYNPLYSYFFGVNKEKQVAADRAISKALIGKLELSHITMALLYRWLLERHKEQIEHPVGFLQRAVDALTITDETIKEVAQENKIFSQFVKEYNEIQTWKSFFILHYGEDYMKTALQIK